MAFSYWLATVAAKKKATHKIVMLDPKNRDSF